MRGFSFRGSFSAASQHGSALVEGPLRCPSFCCCRTESSKKKAPIYKVMLHNDNYNRREYVVKILLKTVEGLTVDDAVNVMQVRCCGCCRKQQQQRGTQHKPAAAPAGRLLRHHQQHAAAVG